VGRTFTLQTDFVMKRVQSSTAQPTTRFLAEHVKRLYANLPGAARGEEEPIHQVRVASRRLRVAFPVAARKPGGRRVLRAFRRLRALTRIAGEGRDLDICANILMETLGGFPNLPAVGLRRAKPASADAIMAEKMTQAGLAAAVATLIGRRLRTARLRAHHRLVESLAGEDVTKLRAILDEIVARGGVKSEDARVILAGNLRREARRALAELEALGKRYDPTALHALRRRIRWLRYFAELDRAFFRGKAANIKDLKNLQETLGQLHDALVFADWIAPIATSWETQGAPDQAEATRAFMSRLHDRARTQHRRFLASRPEACLTAMLKRSTVLLKSTAR
jgi:CHAD domain-containing protein